MAGKKATATPKRASKTAEGAAPSHAKKPPPKRTGRPATGIKNVGRSVSMPIELWEWVEGHELGRSQYIESLVRKDMAASSRRKSRD